MRGRAVREVAIELFQKWVEEPDPEPTHDIAMNQQWLDELLALAVPPDTSGPTARDLLEEGRNRLDRVP